MTTFYVRVIYETAIIIALGSGLSILFVLLIVVIIIAIFIFVGSKKKSQRESDVYYDTINTAHPPPIIDLELNIAYDHPKRLKLVINNNYDNN